MRKIPSRYKNYRAHTFFERLGYGVSIEIRIVVYENFSNDCWSLLPPPARVWSLSDLFDSAFFRQLGTRDIQSAFRDFRASRPRCHLRPRDRLPPENLYDELPGALLLNVGAASGALLVSADVDFVVLACPY